MKRENKKKINKVKIALVTIIVAMIIALIALGTNQIIESKLSKGEQSKLSNETTNILEENNISENQVETNSTTKQEANETNEGNKVTSENQTATNQTTSVSTKPATQTTPSNNSSTPTYKNSGVGGLPVLMYHFFYNESAGEKPRDNNFMEISAFEKQLKYLTDNNFYFPTWQEVEDYIDGKKSLPAKSIVITVDDGDESFFRLALPVIEKYDVKVTEFLVTSWNGWFCNDYKSSKVSYQSHSDQMHKGGANGKGVLLSWSYEQVYKDLIESKRVLNGEATVFCYPFGQYNETSKRILKDAGYKLAFTTQGGRVKVGADKYALPRVRMSKGVSLQSFANMVN